MSEWIETTLSEISEEITYGYTASASTKPIGPKFLRITDIVPDRINWDTVPYCDADKKVVEKYKLYDGDIIVARTGATTGYNKIIKQLPHEAIFASYLIRFRINKEKAFPDYIGHILTSNDWYSYVQAISGGSAQPGANAKLLGSFSIPLPPLPEQKAIAGVLSSLDDKIDLLHRQNKTLEAMAETLFRQWFIEETEDDWEEYKVKDFIQHIKISVKPQNEPLTLFNHFSIPSYDNAQKPQVEFGKEIKSNKYKVMENNILVSKLNPMTPRIWAILNLNSSNSICSTEFQVLKPKNTNHFGFFYFLFKSGAVVSELVMAASGTSGSHQRVKPSDILNIAFVVPKTSAIGTFSRNVEGTLLKVEENRKQLTILEKLRKALLPKLMSRECIIKGYE